MTSSLALIISFVVAFLLLPIVIRVFRSIDLLDIPDRRKIHSVNAPSFGGIAIFIGFLFSVLTIVPISYIAEYKYMFSGLLIIFLLGLRDDISSLQAIQKLVIQTLAAVLVVYMTDFQLVGFYGLFGAENATLIDKPLSVVFIVMLTNAFNLIDGIDGLAASIAVIVLSFFSLSFLALGAQSELVLVNLALIGGLLAFLYFNWFPSKVFMGDTGSMLLGFTLATISLKFLNVASVSGHGVLSDSIVLCLAALIVPVYDTLRVFSIRIMRGSSPFIPDRNHIHHGLLRLGLNHAKATLTLIVFNIFMIGLALALAKFLPTTALFFILLILAFSFGLIIDILSSKKGYLGKAMKVSLKEDLYTTKSAS